MQEPIYITGHKNPDTDSICASLAYAHLKQMFGENAVACRIGELNLETKYVLERFNVEPPILLESAKSRIRDIDFDPAILVHPEDTIAKAWDKVVGTRNKSLVVVDRNEHLVGVASMSSLSHVMMLDCAPIRLLMGETPFKNIAEVVEGNIIIDETDYKCNGRVMIPVTKDELTINEYKDTIALVGDDEVIQRHMIESHVACMVIVNNHYISDEMLDLAKEKKIPVIKTAMDVIHVARRIYLAIPIRLIMVQNPVVVNYNEYVEDASQRMSKTRYRSYPVVNDHGRVVGAVSRYHLFKYRKKKFVLVDHNEMRQTIDSIQDAEIIEVIDHHRIGDIETANPIIFRNSNVGSTCSIITQIYKERGVRPDKQTASLLLAAILSDTMNFSSPTTTETDRLLAVELAGIAEISTDELAHEMFAAGATIKGRTNSEILYNDFKEFVIDGFHIGIGQVTILDPKELIEIHAPFNMYLQEINAINKYDILLMAFTNVIEQGSYFMVTGKLRYIVDEAFNRESYATFIPGFVSRKKQILPAIAEALRR